MTNLTLKGSSYRVVNLIFYSLATGGTVPGWTARGREVRERALTMVVEDGS